MIEDEIPCIQCSTVAGASKFCLNCTMKGASLVSDLGHDQLLEKNGKKYAKIFLISSAQNVNGWRVKSDTIPERIRTFIGRPYISEPGLAHFDSDKLTPEQILVKQENFVAGIIKEVVLKDDLTGFAIVEFKDNALGNRTFREMKQGKAIYSSPAIAGKSVTIAGERIFLDWYGLHLARVGDPAYGVFHASIKETCEGEQCLAHLVSTASTTNQPKISSIIQLNSKNTMSEIDEKIAKLEADLATVTAKNTVTEKALADANKQLETAKTVSTADEVDCEAHPEHPMCKAKAEAKAKLDSTKVDPKEFASMKAVLANYQNKEKQVLIDNIVDMKATAGIVNDTNEKLERESLEKMSIESLTEKATELEPMVDRIVQLAGVQSNSADGRIVKMPPTGFASAQPKLPKKLSELNGGWF